MCSCSCTSATGRVRLFAYERAELLRKFRRDFDEIFMRGWACPEKEVVHFGGDTDSFVDSLL